MATGLPEASYEIMLPSVPEAILANVTALSAIFAVVTFTSAICAVSIDPSV